MNETAGAKLLPKILFWIVALSCCAPLCQIPDSILALIAPGALILGIALALTLGNPYPAQSKNRQANSYFKRRSCVSGSAWTCKRSLRPGAAAWCSH